MRRTLQKRKTTSGQAAEKLYKYKYEDVLSFLVPYLGEREGRTNVLGDDDDSKTSSCSRKGIVELQLLVLVLENVLFKRVTIYNCCLMAF